MDAYEERRAPRLVEQLNVPRLGAVVRGTTPKSPPWRVTDADGFDVEFARLWLVELRTSDYSSATLRAYAYDLLRFIDAVNVPWQHATRWEVRDWVRWHQVHENTQRRRNVTKLRSRPPAGSVNGTTGKPYLSGTYSRATLNRMLSSLSGFYEFAITADLGPLVNPVPKSRAQLTRENAHSNPMDPPRRGRRAPYRQRVVQRTPRALSDELYEQVFARLRNDRDREIAVTQDFGSLVGTTQVLVGLFWKAIEEANPGIDTIALTKEQAAEWKQWVRTKPDGTPRRQVDGVYSTVRSFYLDIAAWAHEDPVAWAEWAVPCPVGVADVRGGVKRSAASDASPHPRLEPAP